MALFIGHSSRTEYDRCTYPDRLTESTGTYSYVMNTDRIHNCNGCLTTFGPRGGVNGAGVSTPVGNRIAAAQQLVDIDSIHSNRNVPISKCKRGKVNPVNLRKIKTYDLPECNDYLDGQHTKLTDPAMFYRGAPINRFVDLPRDPQANIYYDWAVNTTLEARDNFVPDLPIPVESDVVPRSGNYIGDMTTTPQSINLNTRCRNNVNSRGRRRMNPSLMKRRAMSTAEEFYG
jgi:hypothetical protein